MVSTFSVLGTQVFAAAVGGVSRSADSGATWMSFSFAVPHHAVVALAAQGTNLFAGSVGAGVFLSTDLGTTWTRRSTGMGGIPVTAITTTAGHVFSSSLAGISRSADGGMTWSDANSGVPTRDDFRSFADDGDHVYAGTSDGLYRTTDSGESWTSAGSGLPSGLVRALAATGGRVLAATYGAVSLSTDGGATWTPTGPGITDPFLTSVAFAGPNFLAGTTGGGLFLSTDGGAHWTSTAGGPGGQPTYALIVAGSRVYAATSTGGVYVSIDAGLNWASASSGLTSAVTAFAAGGESIFAASYDGRGGEGALFATTNGGAGWVRVDSGLGDTRIHSLATTGTHLLAGVESGMWRRALAEMVTSVGPVPGGVPAEFRLEQNYPNPFNPVTTIGYSLGRTGRATLTVHDLLGRTVAVLEDGVREAGEHRVVFDASGLASGVYLCRLSADGMSVTRRLMLVR
jgi:hypothetical protein